jgi:hypothetical protein
MDRRHFLKLATVTAAAFCAPITPYIPPVTHISEDFTISSAGDITYTGHGAKYTFGEFYEFLKAEWYGEGES